MKRVRLFLYAMCVAVASSMLLSCNKSVGESDLVGKWQSTKYELREYEGDKLVAEESETCVDWYLGFDFKSGGDGSMIDYESGESDIISINWVLMGEKLMITPVGGGSALTFVLESVSGSQLVLSMTYEYTDGGVKHKDYETYTFKKI